MAEKESSAQPSSSKDGPQKCQECKIKFPNIYEYAEHLQSKEHRKGVMKYKYVPKYLEAKERLHGSLSEELPKEKEDHIGSSSDDDAYTCEVCEKICTGALNYKLHLSGKKHQKKVKAAKLLTQMKMDKILPDDEDSDEDSLMDTIFTKNEFSRSETLCKICNKTCNGPESLKNHLKSDGHKRKLAIKHLRKDLPLKKTSPSSDSDDSIETCDTCKKSFSGPLPYFQHMKSSIHKKQVQENEKTENFEELITSTDDGRRIKCNECDKLFSGSKPFREHLKGSLHSKLKQKNELLKMIQEKYPEIVITANNEDNIIMCSVCHTAFTGPESARDHLESQKHKKAKKKQTQLEKLKLAKKHSKGTPKSIPDSDKIFKEDNDDHDDSSDFDIIA